MAEETKTKKTYISKILPTGEAGWCHTDVKDTYKNQNNYKAKVVIDKDDAEALIAELDEICDAHYEAEMEKAKGKLKKLYKDGEIEKCPGYSLEYDDEGEETGRVVFQAKSNSKPVVVDAQKKKVPSNKVFKGDQINMAVQFTTYEATEGFKRTGLTCYLKAVQIVAKGNGSNGGGDDFDTVEGGYVAPDADEDYVGNDDEGSNANEDFS